MDKIKDFFKRFIISKDTYQKTKETIKVENLQTLRVYSVIAAVVFFVLTIVSIFYGEIKGNLVVYLVSGIVSIAICLLAFFVASKENNLIRFLIHAFIFLLLGFGICVSCFCNQDNLTVSFVVLLFVSPLLFTEKSLFLNLDTLLAIAVYFVCGIFTQKSEILMTNLINVAVFGSLSIAICVIVTRSKFQKAMYSYNLKTISLLDQLTGLANRHAFEKNIRDISNNWSNDIYTLFAFDLNGLKRANDTYGHTTGDALLLDASKCIRKVFEGRGKMFRIGGDEFAVIIKGRCALSDELMKQLAEETSKMKGDYGEKLSISVGVSFTGEAQNVDEWIKLADHRMYESKARFYEKSGVDRRKAE